MPTKRKIKRILPRKELTQAEWQELLRNISRKAIREAFGKGLSVTIAKGGKVFKLHPDRSLEFVEDIPTIERKTSRKILTID